MICESNFMTIGSGIRKLLLVDTNTHTQTQQGDRISLILLFHNEESGLKSDVFTLWFI
jgi:hypothetical protein